VSTSVRPLWRDWVIADAIAALAVVGLGAGLAAWLLRLFEMGWFGIVSSTIVFAVSGGLGIGLLQHRVLQEVMPFLKPGPWATWSGLGAALAWLPLAFPIPVIAPDVALGAQAGWWLQLDAAVALVIGLGLVLAACQTLPLSEWFPRPWRWIVMSLGGWALATPLVLLASSWFDGVGQPAGSLLASGAVLAGGAMVGLVRGRFMRTLVSDAQGGGDYAQHVLGDIGSIDLGD
jgi:hypothetical protein